MPHDAQRNKAKSAIFNVPNQLTCLRLVLAAVLFGFMAWNWFWTSFWLFVVAAGTDWFDGYFARKYGQVTTLGRILDPFADKVIICGMFILLAAVPDLTKLPWGLRAWMVVVIVGRELLRHGAAKLYRGTRGGLFGPDVGQMEDGVAVRRRGDMSVLAFLRSGEQPPPDWTRWLLIASVWSALILTVYSGAVYVAPPCGCWGSGKVRETHRSAAGTAVSRGWCVSRTLWTIPVPRARR